MSDELALLARYNSISEAGICKTALEAEGIAAMILRDDAGGMDPQLQLTQGVRLMVRRDDLGQARELLDIAGRED